MPDRNAEFQGSIPESYDRYLGPVIFEPYAQDLARRLPKLSTGSVLEIACGTGILTRSLRAALPPEVELVATDLSEPMIAYARAKPAFAGAITWRPADAASLPFPDGAFSAAVCQFGFMFVPDKTAAFRESRRVLGRDGLLAFNVWDSFDRNAFGRIAHETIGSFFPVDPPTFYTVPFGFHDQKTIKSMLEGCGFGQVRIDAVAKEGRSPSARSFALGLVHGSPVSLAIAERGAPFEPIVDAVTSALVRAGGDDVCRTPMQALVVTATAA